MIQQGEIPSSQEPEHSDDFFVDVDPVTLRYFYVPREIVVHYPRSGQRMDDIFVLDQNTGTAVAKSAFVHRRASIGNRVIIGPDSGINHTRDKPTIVEDNVLIEDQVDIFPGVKVRKDAIVGKKASVEVSAEVGEGAIIGSRAVVRHNANIAPGAVVFAREIIRAGSFVRSGRVRPQRP